MHGHEEKENQALALIVKGPDFFLESELASQ